MASRLMQAATLTITYRSRTVSSFPLKVSVPTNLPSAIPSASSVLWSQSQFPSADEYLPWVSVTYAFRILFEKTPISVFPHRLRNPFPHSLYMVVQSFQ